MRHPCIIRLRHRFQDRNNIYFLTELAERGELAQFITSLEDSKLDLETSRFIAAQLVDTLDYLHKNGIAHRDLKPANIFLTSEGFLKLGDFGTAYISPEALEKFGIQDHKPKDGD